MINEYVDMADRLLSDPRAERAIVKRICQSREADDCGRCVDECCDCAKRQPSKHQLTASPVPE